MFIKLKDVSLEAMEKKMIKFKLNNIKLKYK